MPNPRNLNRVLGSIGTSLLILGQLWKQTIPPIQAVVTNKASGLPGRGFIQFLDDPGAFRRAPSARQRAILRRVTDGVYSYERWREVLAHFSAQPWPVGRAGLGWWRQRSRWWIHDVGTARQLRCAGLTATRTRRVRTARATSPVTSRTARVSRFALPPLTGNERSTRPWAMRSARRRAAGRRAPEIGPREGRRPNGGRASGQTRRPPPPTWATLRRAARRPWRGWRPSRPARHLRR